MPLLVGWEKTSDAGIPEAKSAGINPTLTGRAINRLAKPEFLLERPRGSRLRSDVRHIQFRPAGGDTAGSAI